MMRYPQVPSGCQLFAHKSIGSTSEEAKQLAEEGAADRTVIWAGEQTSGRGRHGRKWASPPGNLYHSIIFRPDCRVAEASQLGFVVGVAMASAIRALSEIPAVLKWPNDLLVDGKKIAGILLDSSDDGAGGVDWVIAGIGVNVDNHPEMLLDATNLRACGAAFSIEDLIEAFLPKLFELLDEWRQDGFATIRYQWNELALAFGSTITVKLPDRTVSGAFEGIDASGNLIVRHDGSLMYVAAGDVFPVSNSATGVS
ncbi:MAG: biotin--[acetyl-CoA-carboxylase] ligase [Alphaproteobacteria bacterium]|nr:biotin--[acetyl-CoA-carboxylase] ligase [Alphaproteobacteria bacterium]